MSIRPAEAAAATIVSTASLFLLAPRWGGSAYAVALFVTLLFMQRGEGTRLGGKLVAWTMPFLLPLLVVHGVLNSQFPITSTWFDFIPVRGAGLAFGYDLATRVLIFAIVGGYWLSVDRDELVEALLRLRLPMPLIMLAMQGFVMGRIVQERVQYIHLAQRARGIPVSASFFQRAISLPALLVPVVVGTFVEAEARVPVLLAHGFGRIEPSVVPARWEWRTAITCLTILGCLLFAIAMDRI
jgi:energy-coupling factor transporter transmembrane protein EcfT